MSADRFAGQVHLVCGASSGLGKAVAELILSEGGMVWAVSRREALPEAPESRTVRVQADLTTADGVASLLRALRSSDVRLNGVLVNGGGPVPGNALDIAPTQWHDAVNALLVRPLELIRGLRQVLAIQASILFVTSSSVREPIDQLDVSNVLRPGVAALANVLSRQLGPAVRVNSIAPGRISTERLTSVDEQQAAAAGVEVEAHRRAVHADIPLGRYGTPEEFAEAAAFLLSPASSYITGAAVQIDGGLLSGV